MGQRFEWLAGSRIEWPAMCAICGATEVVPAKAHGGSLEGMGYWGLGVSVKYATLTVPFPLCRHHKVVFLGQRFLYFVSFFVFLFGAPTGLGMLLIPRPEWIAGSVLLGIGLASLALFLYCYFAAPVRLWRADNGALLMSIRSEGYARQFAVANPHLYPVKS